MVRYKKSFKYLFFVFSFYILIFQNLIQNFIKPIQFFDEILALVAIPLIIIKMIRDKSYRKIKKNNIFIVLSLLAIFIIGIVSNVISGIQPLRVALSDALLLFKFFLAYFLSMICWNDSFFMEYSKGIKVHVKIVVYLLFFLSIINYIFIIWPTDYRFGILANKLFYSHQTMLAAISVFLIAILFLLTDNIKNEKKEFIVSILLLLSTLRIKAIGAGALIIFFVLYTLKAKKKLSFSIIGLLGLLAIIIAWDQIGYYYIDLTNSARNQLTIKSFEIARDFFPFGSGFGTYGSYISGVHYSSLYYSYNLYNIWGLTRLDPAFISDTFWPMIIGQLGFIGTVLYISILFVIFKDIQKQFNNNNIYIYIAKIICFGYLIISSTSESAFVNPAAIPLAIILGISVSKITEKDVKND